MEEDSSPNWPKWHQVRYIAIWEGVALSLSIEPSRVIRSVSLGGGSLEPRFHLGPSFEERLLIASRSFEIKGGQHEPAGSSRELEDRQVERSKFVKWMLDLSWSDSPEFATLGKHEEKGLREDSDPVRGKFRRSLLIMLHTMAKKKYGFNAQDQKHPAVQKILSDITSEELSLDDETIKKWLLESASAVADEIGRKKGRG